MNGAFPFLDRGDDSHDEEGEHHHHHHHHEHTLDHQ
jgi:hypothetical protein